MEPLLARISAMSIDLVRGRHPVDAVLQYRVASALAPRTRRGRSLVARMAANPTTILIQEEQLAVLARYALTYSQSGDSWPDNGDELLLDAMLGFNSLAESEIHAGADTTSEWFLRKEIRSSAADSENVANVLRRYGEFSNWAASDDARNARDYLDLDSLFHDATGLSYIEFATATFAFYVHFGGAAVKHPAEFKPFLELEPFCSQLRDGRVLRTWVQQTVVTATKARHLLGGLPESMSIASLYPVMNTPLVEIRPGAIACPALRYLPNVAGNGLIFRLVEFLEKRDGAKRAKQFRGFFGTFLEAYVFDILKRSCCELADVTLFRELIYGRDTKRSSDIAIFRGSTAVFVDVTSKRFNTIHSLIELDRDYIDRDLRAMITGKYKQINDRAADFRSGELRYTGIDAQNITDIVGLVVTPQGLARFYGVNERIEALREPTDHLSAVEFFDLNEVEIIEDAYRGRLDLHELVKTKLADPPGRTRTLTNYLFIADRQRLRQTKSNEELLAEPWFQRVLETARGWGMPGDALDESAPALA